MKYTVYWNRAGCVFALVCFVFARPATADLVGFWSFDDATATDLSGNGNDGEVIDLGFSDDVPPGTTGKSLDASEPGEVIVEHSDSLEIADTMTIAFWMKADNFEQESNWNGPLSKIEQPRSESGWEMQRFDTQSRIDIRVDTNAGNNSVKGNLVGTYEDEWVHLAWTLEEGFWVAFMDGELISSGDYPHGDGFANEADLYFGTRKTEDLPFQGLLDEIGLWDEVLSDEAIASLAEGIQPPELSDPCDFDGDGMLGVGDVNLLSAAIAGGDMDAKFDVNSDGAVDRGDLSFFVKDQSKLHTWIGDANLDGEFGSTDLVAVFTAGKYEVDTDASWGEGDWDANLRFGSGDLVAAFTDGGYELGPRDDGGGAIPEPSGLGLLLLGSLAIGRRRR